MSQFVFAAMFLACSPTGDSGAKDSASGEDGGGTEAMDQWVEDHAALVCGRIWECSDDPMGTTGYTSEGECASFTETEIEGKLGSDCEFDTDAAEACSSELEAMTCDDVNAGIPECTDACA